LIQRNVEVYFSDPQKQDFSPIFFAIKCNNLQVVELICDKGLALDHCLNSNGYTPLTYSVALNHYHILNYLSLRNCKIDQEDPTGQTPFMRLVL
jgi:ankyrin repeat protein